jgi:hypothetical protein
MATQQAELKDAASPARPGGQVSLFHHYGLRLVFLLMALFLLSSIGPRLAEPPPNLMTGAARALFTALGLMAAIGVRYPLQMLPIMMFEFTWKALWVAFIGLPLWAAGRLDPDSAQTFFEVGIGVILVPVVMPWGYVFENYLKRPADRWR